MNKQELIGHVADRAGLSRNDAMRAVETMLEVITSTLKRGDEVHYVESVGDTGPLATKVWHKNGKAN